MNPAELAARCLIAAGVRTLPVDVRLLLSLTRGTYVFSERQALRETDVTPEALRALSDEVPAFTCEQLSVNGLKRRVVVYRTDADPVRLRFTLAHEFGHIALKHRTAGNAPGLEGAANRFARLLLMPPPLVRSLARERPVYAEQLCEVFGITLSSALRPDLSPVTPAAEAALCGLLEEAVRRRLPAAVSPRWHRISIPC